MNIKDLMASQKAFFLQGDTLSYEFRRNSLLALRLALKTNEAKLIAALKADLNKSEFEAYMTELGPVYSEISFAIKHLKKWLRKDKVRTPLALFKAQSYIYHEPMGNTLIIAPWNYPVNLFFSPLIGAICGGNTCILKPSELARSTSKIMSEIINESFNSNYIYSLEGDRDTVTELLGYHFDLIFYTGSTRVGKIIMEKASSQLTPVILELGGKSPCIVTKTANIALTAKRIIFGKLLNAGQTCVAPDYVYCDASIKEELLKALATEMKLQLSSVVEYPKIINSFHQERLLNLVDKDKIYYSFEEFKGIILDKVSFLDKVMQEEIFGPILPVIAYASLAEAINILSNLEHPLAMYIFSSDSQEQHELLKLRFGGGVINDTIMHLASPYLPFGGVGNSGLGSYHGYASFLAFTHQKSICNRSTRIDMKLRYNPYTAKKMRFMRNIYK